MTGRPLTRTLRCCCAVLWAAWAFGQGMGGSVKAIPRTSGKTKVDLPSPHLKVRDLASESGLSSSNVYGGATAKKFILEMTGNGVAVVDFDNDGWRDLFFVNGTRLDAAAPAPHRLYRNLGDGRFEDATKTSGIANQGWGQGVCAGDYDNDGFTDLLVTYYGHNVLHRNLGSGRFEDATKRAGLPVTGQRWATGCTFIDYDRDGLLDLFVSNYVLFDLARTAAPGSSPFCFWRGLSVFCGPKGFPTGQNALYRNEGGRFVDVSKKAGILVEGLHYGLGVVASDFDNDGWTDIYVACDSTPSILYRNNRDGTFTDVSVEAGAAYGDSGQEQGSMGVAAADYDNDGLPDIVKTNFMDETSTLYRNLGGWFFEDSTYAAGLGIHTKIVGWGVEFLDFDHDGWKDIFMANGHIYPELEGAKVGESYRQSKILYWNLRNGAFRDITGADLAKPYSSRGAATGDFDGDGALEVAVVNMNEPPSLFRLDLDRGNAILVELIGMKSNRSAIGARVTLESDGLKLVDEVRSGSSFASQSDFRLHFGVGKADVVDKVRVRWPNGGAEELGAVKVNQWITVKEGAGIVSQRPFRSPAASQKIPG
ncbi:MAG: CRTAC1 family protein [Bryobacteraceae bacterium]